VYYGFLISILLGINRGATSDAIVLIASIGNLGFGTFVLSMSVFSNYQIYSHQIAAMPI
jgi:hypothetical protein